MLSKRLLYESDEVSSKLASAQILCLQYLWNGGGKSVEADRGAYYLVLLPTYFTHVFVKACILSLHGWRRNAGLQQRRYFEALSIILSRKCTVSWNTA